MPTIAVADETDACFDTIELREREREREREVERGRPPSSDERVRPIPDLGDHVGNVSLLRKNLNPVNKKPKSSVTTRNFKWQNDDRGGGTTTGRWFI